MTGPDQEFTAKLKSLGEKEVRRRLIDGEFGSQGLEYTKVKDWLDGKSRTAIGCTNVAAWIAAIAAVGAVLIGLFN